MQDGRASARPSSVTTGDLGTGARIGRYVIIEKVGTGAMGVVYGAYDPELDRKIALKLIKPGHGIKDTAQARLLREAKAIARLAHPNVVAVHDAGVLEDQVFLAMEFVAGGTIKSWLDDKPRTWREVLDVFIAAGTRAGRGARGRARAPRLQAGQRAARQGGAAARRRLRHRATGGRRPTTIRDAADRRARSPRRRCDESSGNVAPLLTLTKTGTLVGTPAYMAPEQFLGERGDERSDQFSFCVALYEALYGVRPFAGNDFLSISVNVTTEQLRPLPKDRDVPAWIRRLILRGLKADPAARWESMAALIRALGDDPDIKLRRRFIAGGTIAVGAVSLLIAWQMVSRRRAEADREIARHIKQADVAVGIAHDKLAEARGLRERALKAFDAFDKPDRRRPVAPDTGALARDGRGVRSGRAKLGDGADGGRGAHRTSGAASLTFDYEHLLFAEDFRMSQQAERARGAARVGGRRWQPAQEADGARHGCRCAPRRSPVASYWSVTNAIRLTGRRERQAGRGHRRCSDRRRQLTPGFLPADA